MKRRSLRQQGFTIIELMIATAVLSTILLLVTVIMVNIGNLYYKGINQARVQDNARSLSDEIAQQLKLGDTMIPSDPADAGPNGEQAYCIGPVRYTYVTGVQIGQPAPGSSAPAFQHILWRDDNPVSGTCTVHGTDPVDLASTTPSSGHGAELIAPNSRLTEFNIVGNSPYMVAVGVAYGDNDLLCNPTADAASCGTGVAMTNPANYIGAGIHCKGHLGDQFCATARLTTTVIRRLQ